MVLSPGTAPAQQQCGLEQTIVLSEPKHEPNHGSLRTQPLPYHPIVCFIFLLIRTPVRDVADVKDLNCIVYTEGQHQAMLSVLGLAGTEVDLTPWTHLVGGCSCKSLSGERLKGEECVCVCVCMYTYYEVTPPPMP